MNSLTTLTTSIPLHTVITLGFYGATAMYIIFTIILYFHWNEYSINDGVTRTTLALYFLTTIPLVMVMGICVLII